MKPSIFKFSNINIARFVAEQLNKKGHNARALSSGFVSIESVLDDAAVALIEEQRGTVVVAGPSVTPVISKFSGAASMVDRRKLPPPVEEPKSPPTANSKSLKKYGNTANSQTKGFSTESFKVQEAEDKSSKSSSEKTSPEDLKSFALDTLKKVVEKYPNRFPKLAKMFGIKVKS